MQRATMRRIDIDDAAGALHEPDEDPCFGAVPVQHIRLQSPDQACELRPRQNVRGRGLAVNGDAMNAELETGREFGQCLVGALAAGEAVGDNPDMVAAIGLSMSKVEDVTENPADRRAYRVQDAERLVWLR